MVGVDIDNTVGTRVVVAAHSILLNVIPRRLFNGNVVEFQPVVVQRAVDVCPVVS